MWKGVYSEFDYKSVINSHPQRLLTFIAKQDGYRLLVKYLSI